jgi:hypothetical protein
MKNKYIFNISNLLTPIDMSLALNKLYVEELIYINPEVKFCILLIVKTMDGE